MTFRATFGGLDITPVSRGLRRMAGLIDPRTVPGDAIKFLLVAHLQPMLDRLEQASIAVEASAVAFLKSRVKAYIAAKPRRQSIDDPALAKHSASADAAGTMRGPVLRLVRPECDRGGAP